MATVFVMVVWLLGCLAGLYARRVESSILRDELRTLRREVEYKQLVIKGQGERIAQLVEKEAEREC